jgi:hypothetical protein
MLTQTAFQLSDNKSESQFNDRHSFEEFACLVAMNDVLMLLLSFFLEKGFANPEQLKSYLKKLSYIFAPKT